MDRVHFTDPCKYVQCRSTGISLWTGVPILFDSLYSSHVSVSGLYTQCMQQVFPLRYHPG